jgi:hypothetical protein
MNTERKTKQHVVATLNPSDPDAGPRERRSETLASAAALLVRVVEEGLSSLTRRGQRNKEGLGLPRRTEGRIPAAQPFGAMKREAQRSPSKERIGVQSEEGVMLEGEEMMPTLKSNSPPSNHHGFPSRGESS